jgi:acyl-CoA dehydrogenase
VYGLTDEDRAAQATARGFADELVPFEVEAELAGGTCPRRSSSSTGTGRASSG